MTKEDQERLAEIVASEARRQDAVGTAVLFAAALELSRIADALEKLGAKQASDERTADSYLRLLTKDLPPLPNKP